MVVLSTNNRGYVYHRQNVRFAEKHSGGPISWLIMELHWPDVANGTGFQTMGCIGCIGWPFSPWFSRFHWEILSVGGQRYQSTWEKQFPESGWKGFWVHTDGPLIPLWHLVSLPQESWIQGWVEKMAKEVSRVQWLFQASIYLFNLFIRSVEKR